MLKVLSGVQERKGDLEAVDRTDAVRFPVRQSEKMEPSQTQHIWSTNELTQPEVHVLIERCYRMRVVELSEVDRFRPVMLLTDDGKQTMYGRLPMPELLIDPSIQQKLVRAFESSTPPDTDCHAERSITAWIVQLIPSDGRARTSVEFAYRCGVKLGAQSFGRRSGA